LIISASSFIPTSNGYIQAYIDNYEITTPTISYGQTFQIKWNVKLGGSELHTYYFGASVQDQHGQWYDIPFSYYTGTDEYVTNDFRWTPPSHAPEGNYLVRIAVWGGESGGLLQDRLNYIDIPNAFRLTSSSYNNIDIRLSDVRWDAGPFTHGDIVSVQPYIINNGRDTTFYVGYSVRDRFGIWWDAPYQSIYLRTGDSASLDLKWKVPYNAPEGHYDFRVAVWEGVDTSQNPHQLLNRLDYRDYSGAFEIRGVTSNAADIISFDLSNRSYGYGDYVNADVTVRNLGSAHQFYVGFSVKDRYGTWWDAPYDSIYLGQGETGTITLKWKIPPNAPKGGYLARVSVWDGVNTSTEPDELVVRLDNAEIDYDAFLVKGETEPVIGTTSGGDTVNVSTGPQQLGPATVNVEYGFDLEVKKPDSISPGQTAEISVMPKNERMLVTVGVGGSDYTIEFPLALGSEVPVDIYPGIEGYFVTTAISNPSVSGPSSIDTSWMDWNESTPRTFSVTADSDSRDGDEIILRIPTSVAIDVGLNLDLFGIKQNIGQTRLGTFDAYPIITEKIRIVEPRETGFGGDMPGGGCLIATAAYGTELAPQVQILREIRDNVLFGTNSGTVFLMGFNQFYYTFSPTIADWERQNPAFRELVKTAITPMLSTLSILNYVDIDSESEMLGYGIGIILLNIGMYFVVPVIILVKLKNFRRYFRR